MLNVFLGPQPERFLGKCEKELSNRIISKLIGLSNDPFPADVKRVIGRKNKAFRVRLGEYRIQYIINHNKKEILVFDISKRSKAY